MVTICTTTLTATIPCRILLVTGFVVMRRARSTKARFDRNRVPGEHRLVDLQRLLAGDPEIGGDVFDSDTFLAVPGHLNDFDTKLLRIWLRHGRHPLSWHLSAPHFRCHPQPRQSLRPGPYVPGRDSAALDTLQAMETIVVPLDDSLDPHLAVRTAFSLAERTECSVSLVSSCPAEQANEVAQSLCEAGDRFTHVAPHTIQILDGPPIEAVLDAAPPGRAIICMPTHARAGLSRLIFGSMAEDLIRHSTQPILCVGPDVADVPLPKEKSEILVCTDDSSASPLVFDAAADFAEWLDASCVIAQVVGPDEDVTTDGGPPPQPIRDQAERHCQQAADRLGTHAVPATSHLLHGHAPSSIVQYARTRASSFIVVGTSGRTGLTRHTLGSVAAGVVRHARCPVLVVPTLNRAE